MKTVQRLGRRPMTKGTNFFEQPSVSPQTPFTYLNLDPPTLAFSILTEFGRVLHSGCIPTLGTIFHPSWSVNMVRQTFKRFFLGFTFVGLFLGFIMQFQSEASQFLPVSKTPVYK